MCLILHSPFSILHSILPLLFLLAAFGCSIRPDAQDLRTFVEAQEAFEKAGALPATEQKAEFRRVARMYRSLTDRGVRSGPIYYNQGNAWARAEEPGQAIAAYHLALRYTPLDPHIAQNLQHVLGSAVPLRPPTPLIEHLFFWQDWIGVRWKVMLATTFIVLTFACAVAHLFVRHRRVRRLVGIGATLSAIAIASVVYDWYRFDMQSHAVVAVTEAMPRKGNSEQYEAAFTSPVALGTVATVVGGRGHWIQLHFGSGQTAWLPKEQVVVY